MRTRGFTLIELLVVISIISLLSSIVLAAISSARDKADNAYRIQMMNEYAKAFVLYKEDHGGLYPADTSSSNSIICLTSTATCTFVGGVKNSSASLTSSLAPYITLQLPFKTLKNSFLPPNADYDGPFYNCPAPGWIAPASCTAGAPRLIWIMRGNTNCLLETEGVMNNQVYDGTNNTTYCSYVLQ